MRGKKLRRVFLGLVLVALLVKTSALFKSKSLKLPGKVDESYRELEDLVSENAILMERSSQTILMGKNYQARIHPASMTKVMTGLVALENGSSRKKITIEDYMIDYCKKEGLSMSGFQAGERIKLIDLVYGLLLESGGEAALALGEGTVSSQEEFIDLMNQKARELGMEDSHFSNVTGATDSENYTTAEDMARLYDHALNNKKFRKIVESKKHKAGNGLEINNLLFQKRASLDIDKDHIVSGKTGYTKAAGLCLVSMGELAGREYIALVAKADGNSQSPQYNLIDTDKIYSQYRAGF